MIRILVHGADPEDLRYDESGDDHMPSTDDALRLSNEVHSLLVEEFGYLGVTGVEVDVSNVSAEDTADFPGDT